MIWTTRHWVPAILEATSNDNKVATQILREHHFHIYHCGGYDVHAWPCPAVAKVLDELLGGAE